MSDFDDDLMEDDDEYDLVNTYNYIFICYYASNS